jgi:hypothetical protein
VLTVAAFMVGGLLDDACGVLAAMATAGGACAASCRRRTRR